MTSKKNFRRHVLNGHSLKRAVSQFCGKDDTWWLHKELLLCYSSWDRRRILLEPFSVSLQRRCAAKCLPTVTALITGRTVTD